MNLWLTVADVAKRLNVTPDTVRDLERRGRLNAIRTVGGVRLFKEAEVERFLQHRQLQRRVWTKP
jgi:excisionase family DNA binding protein